MAKRSTDSCKENVRTPLNLKSFLPSSLTRYFFNFVCLFFTYLLYLTYTENSVNIPIFVCFVGRTRVISGVVVIGFVRRTCVISSAVVVGFVRRTCVISGGVFIIVSHISWYVAGVSRTGLLGISIVARNGSNINGFCRRRVAFIV